MNKLFCLTAWCLVLLVNFESNSGSSDSIKNLKESRVNVKRFEPFQNELIDHYFETFKPLVGEEGQKKLYDKLAALVEDCNKLLLASTFVSHQKMTEFIEAGLERIHKLFDLGKQVPETQEQNRNQGEEVIRRRVLNDNSVFLHSNAHDEDFIKSDDYKFIRSKRINEQLRDSSVDDETPMVPKNKIKLALNKYNNKFDHLKNRNKDVHPKFFEDLHLKGNYFDLMEMD